jgi:hypothetical protein
MQPKSTRVEEPTLLSNQVAPSTGFSGNPTRRRRSRGLQDLGESNSILNHASDHCFRQDSASTQHRPRQSRLNPR